MDKQIRKVGEAEALKYMVVQSHAIHRVNRTWTLLPDKITVGEPSSPAEELTLENETVLALIDNGYVWAQGSDHLEHEGVNAVALKLIVSPSGKKAYSSQFPK